MSEQWTNEKLLELCEDFIMISIDYDKYDTRDDPKWKAFISKMCNIHYDLGNWINAQDEIDEHTLYVYMHSGERLAEELKRSNDWAKIEAIYFHLSWIYKKYADEVDEFELSYYQECEKEAQSKKHEQQSSGCFGCLGILIVVGILYKILF